MVKRMFPKEGEATSSAIDPANYISTYLENAGSNDMAVDGSSTPVQFVYSPPAGKRIEVARMIIYMQSPAAQAPDEFGSLDALTNGVDVVADGNVIENWKDNTDILVSMYDTAGVSEIFSTLVDRTLRCRWTFTKGTGGESLRIFNQFSVIVNDDIDALVALRMKIQGELIPR